MQEILTTTVDYLYDALIKDASLLELGFMGLLTLACLYMVVDILKPAPPPPKFDLSKKKEPIVPRDFTAAELAKNTGKDGSPIYLCVKGKIFDVTGRPQFYGPGTSYGVFAGHDASYCLAKMSTDAADLDKPIQELTGSDIETLEQWEAQFTDRYDVIGTLIDAPSLKQ